MTLMDSRTHVATTTVQLFLMSISNVNASINNSFLSRMATLIKGVRFMIFDFTFQLFDFIAECLFDFMLGITLKASRIPLGVTFGFPIEQTSLQDCTLLRWTQGFNCKDLVGRNIFTALKNAFRKYSVSEKILLDALCKHMFPKFIKKNQTEKFFSRGTLSLQQVSKFTFVLLCNCFSILCSKVFNL